MKIPPKLNLANLPTPVQEISFQGKKFLIKRDDLTGMELSGNKVRKLEYILAQAKKEKTDIVLSKPEYSRANEIMFEERKKLIKKGKNVYVIPEGGSTTLGIWGYISFMYELNKQIDLKTVDGMLTTAGSGGTAAGLLLGSSLLKLNLKIYAVNVLYSESVIRNKIIQLADAGNLEYKLGVKVNKSDFVILDGYSNEGYKNISKVKVELIKSFFCQTGILLDPAYTGKTFAAFNDNFLDKKKGEVIFLHTGGLFGVFGKRKEYLIA